MPLCLRVDNGTPWGNWNDFPTPFALWVVGVGLSWHWNDPCRPQQNPKIERSQGTAKRWGEPALCHSVEQLQANLDEADQIHREEYLLPEGKTRWQLFSGLAHSGRRYSQRWEKANWSLLRVKEYLSEYVGSRKVSSSGHISMYYRNHYVGIQYAGQEVQIQYDPLAHQWLVSDWAGCELRRYEAEVISRRQIESMSFRKQKPKE